jgi:hypothetical protein
LPRYSKWRISDAPNFENSLQTRRGTDWQSEHRKQAQQHDLELGTVCPSDETLDQHWPRKTPSTHVQFASTARSHASHEAFGPAASVTTPSQAALGNHSPEPPMQTTEFSDDPLTAPQPPIWHSSLNKLQWTTNVHWPLAKSLKKSEPLGVR